MPQNVPFEPGPGRIFLDQTKYPSSERPDQVRGLPQPPLELPPDADNPIMDLPAPAEITVPDTDLRTAIEQRRSVRSFVREPLSL